MADTLETRVLPYGQESHDALVRPSHDEQSRQEFVKSAKAYLATTISPGNKDLFEKVVEPNFEATHSRAPADRHEVRKEMEKENDYRAWCVERQLPEMIERAGDLDDGLGATLRLDESLEIPRYQRLADIHRMPGGYHSEVTKNDIGAGAIYDRAVYLYAWGRMGTRNDDMGASTVEYIKREFPDFKPRRILDLGCSVGHSTIPYVDAFPDAEVYAVDVAAPVLRYAQARANALGRTVHFSQQNAELTDFPDGYFDLVVSHILLHETSRKAIGRIMAETYRVLAPGGLTLHAEVPQCENMTPYDVFALDWDTYYNNEPFWGTSHDMSLVDLCVKAGFDAGDVIEETIPSAIETVPGRNLVFEGGDFGGAGEWFVFGATKASATEEQVA